MWTSPHRFSPVFLRIQERKDWLRLWSMALGVKRPDQTGLPNTNLLYFESDLMERISDYLRDCTQLQNTRRKKTFTFRTMVWIPTPIPNLDTRTINIPRR